MRQFKVRSLTVIFGHSLSTQIITCQQSMQQTWTSAKSAVHSVLWRYIINSLHYYYYYYYYYYNRKQNWREGRPTSSHIFTNCTKVVLKHLKILPPYKWEWKHMFTCHSCQCYQVLWVCACLMPVITWVLSPSAPYPLSEPGTEIRTQGFLESFPWASEHASLTPATLVYIEQISQSVFFL